MAAPEPHPPARPRHERELWAAWQAQQWRNLPLTARSTAAGRRETDGEPIQVVHRGRWSGGSGPDFRDAIIATAAGTLWRGDIELHLRTSGWTEHGHERDPDYAGVVLHPVLDDDAPPARRCDGAIVPTLPLARHLPSPVPPPGTPPASGVLFQRAEPADVPALVGLLRRLGELRFQDKATRFAGELADRPPAEVLWLGLLDGLGYARNRAGFRELGARLPWAILETELLPLAPEHRPAAAAALILGAAGLLPSGEAAGAARAPLNATWRRLRERWALPGEAPIRWELRRVRPENAPRRRAAAAVAWALRAAGCGLLAHCLGAFRTPDRAPPDPAALEGPLLVGEEPGLRLLLADAGIDLAPGALVGRDRAGEIVVNVLLPFAAAWADSFELPWLAETALDAFRRYRPLAGNEITRHLAAELGLTAMVGVRLGACHQQGLLQIHAWHRAAAFDRLAEHGLLERLRAPLQLGLPLGG